jgi:riboflavin synthase
MFTGLIEEVGSVVAVRAGRESHQLQLAAPGIAQAIQLGDSVAINGCCLTVSTLDGDVLGFDLLDETLQRTNLGAFTGGSRVNLERALGTNGRLGGHFVQGHVDCAAPIIALDERGADLRVEVRLPAEFARYVASKGSIALNGISLTVAEILPRSFVVWIIPHTRAQTNLSTAHPGDLVNLEFDILAKYVERMLDPHVARRT